MVNTCLSSCSSLSNISGSFVCFRFRAKEENEKGIAGIWRLKNDPFGKLGWNQATKAGEAFPEQLLISGNII